MKIAISRHAYADLERLREFLETRNRAAALKAVATIASAIDSLADFPDQGRRVALSEDRELTIPFGRNAYVVRYSRSLPDELIVIRRVWHGRENRT